MRAVIYNDFNSEWMEFENPEKIIQTKDIDDVIDLLKFVEEYSSGSGKFAAGFISYDSAPAFDSALKVRTDGRKSVPLLYFGIFQSYKKITIPPSFTDSEYSFEPWISTVSESEYKAAVSKVKELLRNGETYQVNYTLRSHSKFSGAPWKLFCSLVNSQRSNNCAFIETDDFAVCSASPELFFTFKDGIISSKPMKGTAARGLTSREDLKQAEWLHKSAKNRSENIMIVDMIRNDIGRVAAEGSVIMPRVFEVEKYPTVWQMTSTVQANTTKSISDIMKALFPCASITGAPKVRTMEIISELEKSPRGVYTGSIGFISSSGDARFNVAIRTVYIDKRNYSAEYGVGGGIVWDSTPDAEYEECLIKTEFLSNPIPSFSILESLLWDKESYFLLEEHINRMRQSADYFSYPFDEVRLRKALLTASEAFSGKTLKVRALLDINGNVNIENAPVIVTQETIKASIASSPVNSKNPFLYHKTTNRKIYDSFKKLFHGSDEVILWNEKGEVTEGIYSNIAVEINGILYTPPISCGLLGGTFRQKLLDEKRLCEQVIMLEQLISADAVFFINSVRKIRRCIILRN